MGIKILLADDHKMMREGLRALIEEQPDMAVIAEAEDGRSAVQLATTLSPDVIIMDVSMPRLNGIEATRKIVAKLSHAKILALSMHYDRKVVMEILNAGASGYLLKDCAFEELACAIHAVADDRTYLSQQITDVVIKEYVHRLTKPGSSALPVLTAREREVLQLLAEGNSTREIASHLKVSAKTVETYRKHIMLKLNIHTIAGLTKYAIREGLTSLER